MSRLAPLILWLVLALPAQALTRADLAAVEAAPAAGARAPLDAAFIDEAGRATTLGAALGGRPGVLIFADYRCTYLCGPGLVLTAAALEKTGLSAGADYRLAAIGLDPRDGPAEARAMRAARLGGSPAAAGAATLLSGRPEAAARALGYRYRYDAEHDQFAHAATLYVLAADGRVVQAMSELALDPALLRQALVEAARGGRPAGGLVGAVRALCYALDPSRGVYDRPVVSALRFGAAATVVALCGVVVLALRRRRSP
jgi:protein SCO1/2